MNNRQSPRFDRLDWIHLFLCLAGGCCLSFGLLYVVLQTILEPKLLAETALRTSRSVRLVELSLLQLPPQKLPEGVIVKTSQTLNGPEGGLKPLGAFDRKVQQIMASHFGVRRELQRDQAPFVESWGGIWVHLKSPAYPNLWVYQPERLSSSSVWFLPLLRSGALLMGLLFGTAVFLIRFVERPFSMVYTQLPDGLPAPLPLLPEQGIAPLRVFSLRINRLLERLNNAARERRLLLRGLAHDLAGPQTRICLQLDLLSDVLGPDHQKDLQAMASDMRQLEGITDQLRILAEQDQPAIAIEQLALDDLCVRVAASYPRQPIRLRIPRLLVRLDGDGFERALRNLIDNALDHGQPPVEVKAWYKQTTLVVQVKDHGAGTASSTLLTMPRSSPAHDRQRSRHRGYGLVIVERFCRDHQGFLSLRPVDGGFQVQMHLVATEEGPVVLTAQSLIQKPQPSK